MHLRYHINFNNVLQTLFAYISFLSHKLDSHSNYTLPFYTQVTIECDIWYHVPDGESSLLESWSDNRTLDEDQQMLMNIEQNIANLEKSFLYNKRGSWSPLAEAIDHKEIQPLLKRENSFSSPETTPKEKKR